jgi:hypothetical protein
MPHDIHLSAGEDFHEAARRTVVAGAENAPVRFWRDGRCIATHGSLFRAAATTVFEEPRLHTARWRPHPRATVDDRLREVVAAEHAAMDAARAQAKKAA